MITEHDSENSAESLEQLDFPEVRNEVSLLDNNPAINDLVNTHGSMVAILNENQQCLILNKNLLQKIGVRYAEEITGLGFCELIGCICAKDSPGNCGKAPRCNGCGVSEVILGGISRQRHVVRKCRIEAERENRTNTLIWQIRSCPIQFREHLFLVLSIHDIGYHAKLMGVERNFFHEISNILSSIMGASQLLALGNTRNPEKFIDIIHSNAARMAKKVEIHRTLRLTQIAAEQPVFSEITVAEILNTIKKNYAGHPVARQKSLTITSPHDSVYFNTDASALVKILDHMIVNAFEATLPGGEVKITATKSGTSLTFLVWNQKSLCEETAKNIFNLGFSTKSETGRGRGTFLMKYYGENILGGKLLFRTSETDGTVFSLHLAI